MNIIVQREYELSFYDLAVQHVSQYTTPLRSHYTQSGSEINVNEKIFYTPQK